MILKVVGDNNSERLFEVLIHYKELTDFENNWLKIWCSSTAFLYQFIMDFNAQVYTSLPTISNDEVAKDEIMK